MKPVGTLTRSISKAWASGISGHPGKHTSSFLFVHWGLTNYTQYLAHAGTPPGESCLVQFTARDVCWPAPFLCTPRHLTFLPLITSQASQVWSSAFLSIPVSRTRFNSLTFTPFNFCDCLFFS